MGADRRPESRPAHRLDRRCARGRRAEERVVPRSALCRGARPAERWRAPSPSARGATGSAAETGGHRSSPRGRACRALRESNERRSNQSSIARTRSLGWGNRPASVVLGRGAPTSGSMLPLSPSAGHHQVSAGARTGARVSTPALRPGGRNRRRATLSEASEAAQCPPQRHRPLAVRLASSRPAWEEVGPWGVAGRERSALNFTGASMGTTPQSARPFQGAP